MAIVPNNWFDLGHPLNEIAYYLYDNPDGLNEKQVGEMVSRLSAMDTLNTNHQTKELLMKKIENLQDERNTLVDELIEIHHSAKELESEVLSR